MATRYILKDRYLIFKSHSMLNSSNTVFWPVYIRPLNLKMLNIKGIGKKSFLFVVAYFLTSIKEPRLVSKTPALHEFSLKVLLLVSFLLANANRFFF